jgi:hypothetical protein
MTHTVLRAYCGLNGIHGDDGKTTEREALIVELCEKWFPNGCTTYDAVGLWNCGGQERTIIVEVISDGYDTARDRIRRFAGEYKAFGEQEAVLLTAQPIEADFV